MAVLIASGLRKEFSGDPLFDGVSFRLRRGDRMALAGPNGAGKTTLLRAIIGETSLQGGRACVREGHARRAARPTPAARPGSVAPRVLAVGRRRPRRDRGRAPPPRAGDGERRPRSSDAAPLQRGAGAARARGRLGLARPRRIDPARPRVPGRRSRPTARLVLGWGADPRLARSRDVGRSRSSAARRADEPPGRREPRMARARAHVARRGRDPRGPRPLVPRGGDDGSARSSAGRSRSSSTGRGTPGGARRPRARPPPRRSSIV